MLGRTLVYRKLAITRDLALTTIDTTRWMEQLFRKDKIHLISFRFTVEKLKHEIRKTNDPGPGSYHIHETVGVIPSWDRLDKNERQIMDKQLNTIN